MLHERNEIEKKGQGDTVGTLATHHINMRSDRD